MGEITAVDAYLVGFSCEARVALDELRALLREAVGETKREMTPPVSRRV